MHSPYLVTGIQGIMGDTQGPGKEHNTKLCAGRVPI